MYVFNGYDFVGVIYMGGIDNCWIEFDIGLWGGVDGDVFVVCYFGGGYSYDGIGDVVILFCRYVIVCCCYGDCFLISDKVRVYFVFDI